METLHLQPAQTAPATISVVDHHIKRLADHRRGWASFRPALFDLSHRWQWWALTILNKRMPPPAMPYPRIDFAQGFPEGAAPLKMLRQCLGGDERKFDGFLDWLLFNFGAPDQRELPRGVGIEDLKHWREAFDLSVLIQNPGDWLGHYYETQVISSGYRAASGFFSTPPAVVKLMAELTLKDAKLTDSVNEPCCGTGRILMEASNYCVNLSGNDINPTLVKIATINGWLYMPSLVMPCRDIVVTTEHKLERKLKLVLQRSSTSL
ncbi:N-6 DNA methylase [Bdellovibrionota bacterium FG-2]